MSKTSKRQPFQWNGSLYQEISEIESGNWRGGVTTHELTHVTQKSYVIPSQIKVILLSPSGGGKNEIKFDDGVNTSLW
ncbi:MAG: hypothetical protein KME23_16325 [Goleter apudmare HA4340-LM2]|jgi:hypothetical protein|nr:hypothetical protein [Goleter apudmare HA4340-LM2]